MPRFPSPSTPATKVMRYLWNGWFLFLFGSSDDDMEHFVIKAEKERKRRTRLGSGGNGESRRRERPDRPVVAVVLLTPGVGWIFLLWNLLPPFVPCPVGYIHRSFHVWIRRERGIFSGASTFDWGTSTTHGVASSRCCTRESEKKKNKPRKSSKVDSEKKKKLSRKLGGSY